MYRILWFVALIGPLFFCAGRAGARHPDHHPTSAPRTQEVISDRTPDRLSPITGVPAWKAALHMHGTLSEGGATIRSHHEAAKLLGIDVIWWTDHDHMIVSEAHRATRFGFDSLTEPLNQGEPWIASSNADIALTKSVILFRNFLTTGSAEITTERAATGTGSLKMTGVRVPNNRQSFMYVFNAEGTRRRYALASGITVRIKVFPETTGEQATGVVTAILSYPVHPAVVSSQRLEIHYFLSNTITTPVREDFIYRVPVPYTPGQWNELTLNVSQDAVAGYPFINGLDNALTELLFGIESRNNESATCYFDDLRIDFASTGQPVFDWQRAELDAYNARDEGVRHIQGIEHSHSPRHMLEYGPNTPLPDWIAYEALSPGFNNGWLVNWQAHQDFIGYRISELGHERGAAISYAHPFGTGTAMLPTTMTKEALLTQLLANRAYNSDCLEVGYRQRERPMGDHLWVWDRLALNGVYLTGLGVSDAHGADLEGFLTDPTFSITQYIYADTNNESDLAEALRAGRTYFADPVIFDGTMDIETDTGALMGAIVVTDRPAVGATIRLRDVAVGDTARVIDSGALESTTLLDETHADIPVQVAVDPATGSFVRAEVYSALAGRTEKAFSNPIYFRDDVPEGGIDWRRAAIDVLGVTSRGFHRFDLDGLTWEQRAGTPLIAIAGHHDGGPGRIELDVSALPGSVVVTFAGGLTGVVSNDGHTLVLDQLTGAGTVTIRIPASCPADVSGSGVVDIDDLNALLAHWLADVPAFSAGDVTGDGQVNIDDLNTLLSNWGVACN